MILLINAFVIHIYLRKMNVNYVNLWIVLSLKDNMEKIMKITYSFEVDEEFDECADALRRALDEMAQEFFDQEVSNSRVDTPFEMSED